MQEGSGTQVRAIREGATTRHKGKSWGDKTRWETRKGSETTDNTRGDETIKIKQGMTRQQTITVAAATH